MTAIGVILEDIGALDDSKGAKPETRHLRHELTTFENVLVAIRELDLDDTSIVQHDALEQASDEGYNSIHRFFDAEKVKGS